MDAIKAMSKAPETWYKSEVEQMRKIHKCFRDAMKSDPRTLTSRDMASLASLGSLDSPTDGLPPVTDEVDELVPDPSSSSSALSTGELRGKPSEGGESATVTASGSRKRDPEAFLPLDSPLRSKDGDMAKPANPPFARFEAFEASCSFDYWRPHFQESNGDRFLGEVAESIVSHVCLSQSRGELRVSHGSLPFRSKREHITPLTLAMHELKMWATHKLRTASVLDEATYMDIGRRTRYVEMLQKKVR